MRTNNTDMREAALFALLSAAFAATVLFAAIDFVHDQQRIEQIDPASIKIVSR